jgi:peptidoglycan/LPS O-acetylase OafA/YrhL
MRDMPNLDFLRSVAVISVVVEHSLLALNIRRIGPYDVAAMGVLGVLVFFVLTALVLMWSLERKPHTLDFYIRRIFRIYPLALAVIAIAFLFHAPTGGTAQHFFVYAHPTYKQLIAQSALIEPGHAQLIGVMWSLPYEVEMYLLLPVLFFFVRKNFSFWPLLTIWALVLGNSRHVPAEGHNFAVAIGYFIPGIMAYVGFGRWRPKLPGWTLMPFLLLMWLLFWYRFDFHRGWYFCLLIGLMLPLFRQMRSKWVLEPSRVIARSSYGIYLTHPFAIVIGIYLLRGQSVPVRVLGELIPLLVLPVAAYHLLEHPMIRWGSRFAAMAEVRYEQREMRHFRETPLS